MGRMDEQAPSTISRLKTFDPMTLPTARSRWPRTVAASPAASSVGTTPLEVVDGDAGERLVHGKEERAVADEPDLVAECLLERLAKDNSDIFNHMMIIDIDIASRLYL